MTCPNSEVNTNLFLKKIGINPTPENRSRIFYTICIFVRLLIAGLALQFKNNKWLPYLVIIFSLITSIRLYNNLYGSWWWSRTYHLIISILLIFVSVLVIINKCKPEYIAYLLYIDVLGGFFQSLGVERC